MNLLLVCAEYKRQIRGIEAKIMRLRNYGDRRSKKNLVLVPPRKRIKLIHVFECCAALCSLLGGNGIV